MVKRTRGGVEPLCGTVGEVDELRVKRKGRRKSSVQGDTGT